MYKAEREQLSEQLARLKESEHKLNEENTKLMRLTNPNAKIQYTQKLKTEINQLAKERESLQTKLGKCERQLKLCKLSEGSSAVQLMDKTVEEVESLRGSVANNTAAWDHLCHHVEQIAASCESEPVAIDGLQGPERASALVNQIANVVATKSRLLREAESKLFILEKRAVLDGERRKSIVSTVDGAAEMVGCA